MKSPTPLVAIGKKPGPVISGKHRQKWSNMANLGRSHHRRWRGVALGGHLQRGYRFCLASQGGQATTGQIAEWCRPEIVYAGGKPTAIQIAKHARRCARSGRSGIIY